MNGVVSYFVKKGDTNLIETHLFVVIRTETRSGTTKRKIRSKQRHIHTILRNTILNPSAWGYLKPSQYCNVGRFLYGVFKF